MNQLCKVCGEPAAGYHFGAFTCEGCKSFFGRTYKNVSLVQECKNGGVCVINKQNRTSCKSCRLKKCFFIGMSKDLSRYGRRSNWFKIHCLLQEQAANLTKSSDSMIPVPTSNGESPTHSSTTQLEEVTKSDGTMLSSPESINSENSIEIARRGLVSARGLSKESDINSEAGFRDGRDFVANFGLYTMSPSLSLLHASQFYSRLYPPMLYPGLASPHLLISPPCNSSSLSPNHLISNGPRSPPVLLNSSLLQMATENISGTYLSSPESSPQHAPPTPPISSFGSSIYPLLPRKREAESPLDEVIGCQNNSGQEGPIDLRIKRRKISSHSSDTPSTPPRSPEIPAIVLPSQVNSVTPVDLTIKA